MHFTGLAIALLISIGCVNLFAIILIKSACPNERQFAAFALQWLKLQAILYILLLIGWAGWNAILSMLGEVGQDERLRIALGIVAAIPSVVMLFYVRRWIGSIAEMRRNEMQNDEVKKDER